MPVYEYRALTKGGRNVNGIIDADNPAGARQKLRASGVFPVEVQETSSRPKDALSSPGSISHFFKRITPGELSAMTRQLSILLEAGVTLVASLDALISQVDNPLLKKVMAQLKESINEGNDLASSLAEHPKVFSQIYVNMVRAGEASGSLDVVLERLAEFSEHQQALRGRIKAAMAYPVFMSLIGTLILLFLITFIVPNMTRIFTEMHQTLPLPTILLISVSNFLKAFWWVVLLAIGGGIILSRRLIKTKKGHYLWDQLKLRVPVMGPINTKIAIARFGRTLGSLVQNGVPVLAALQIVRNIVNNVLIADVIDNAMTDIQEGKTLAAPLAQSSWFPPVTTQMISVGEQSGRLENMLNKIADMYEREVESQTMAMTSMLEPVMILIMGLTVGFIVVSVLLPIFDMNQLIR